MNVLKRWYSVALLVAATFHVDRDACATTGACILLACDRGAGATNVRCLNDYRKSSLYDRRRGCGLELAVTLTKAGNMVNRALLVGINRYPAAPLQGCINDVNDVAKFLVARCEFSMDEIRIVTDDRATTASIRDRIAWLTYGLRSGDRILFYYSGHGSQIAVRGYGGGVIALHDVICPVDFDFSLEHALTDADFESIFRDLPRGVELTWISDSSHSSELARESGEGAFQIRPRAFPMPSDMRWRVATALAAGLKPLGLGSVVASCGGAFISAGRSDQASAEVVFDNRPTGALTYFLLRRLEKSPRDSLALVVSGVGAALRSNDYPQDPELHGNSAIRARGFLEVATQETSAPGATLPVVAETMTRFIVLPLRGMRGITESQRAFLRGADQARTAGVRMSLADPLAVSGDEPQMNVIDSVHEDGAKLVELSDAAASRLRVVQPGLRLVPVVYYQPARAPRYQVRARAASTMSMAIHPAVVWKIKIVDERSQEPIVGANIVAFSNFTRREGAQGTTDHFGEVSLAGFGSVAERLYVYPRATYWGAFRTAVDTTRALQIQLQKVELGRPDGLLARYPGPAPLTAGDGVRVGVLDTGIDLNHPDLVVAGGANTVTGEGTSDYGDNGEEGHGTHVAGVIAGRGMHPTGVRGLAPGVSLYSYRVFGARQAMANNWDILKAIDQAVADGCDLLNLSLGGPTKDKATAAAIQEAYERGTVVIAASGNDGRQPVSYPAADKLVIGVSALGRKGTYPSGTLDEGDVGSPCGADPDDYIPLFSNIGEGIDVTGPGVAVISTLPPGGYGVMSGTSMATPSVVGFSARAIGQDLSILALARSTARSDEIVRTILATARSLGFTPEFVGRGLPQ